MSTKLLWIRYTYIYNSIYMYAHMYVYYTYTGEPIQLGQRGLVQNGHDFNGNKYRNCSSRSHIHTSKHTSIHTHTYILYTERIYAQVYIQTRSAGGGANSTILSSIPVDFTMEYYIESVTENTPPICAVLSTPATGYFEVFQGKTVEVFVTFTDSDFVNDGGTLLITPISLPKNSSFSITGTVLFQSSVTSKFSWNTANVPSLRSGAYSANVQITDSRKATAMCIIPIR